MVDDFSVDVNEFRCLVPFPDASENFVHGFEAGMIWQRMVAGERIIGGDREIATHSQNAEVFLRMAAAQGYDVEIGDDVDGWIIATFTRRPKRFAVIDGGAP